MWQEQVSSIFFSAIVHQCSLHVVNLLAVTKHQLHLCQTSDVYTSDAMQLIPVTFHYPNPSKRLPSLKSDIDNAAAMQLYHIMIQFVPLQAQRVLPGLRIPSNPLPTRLLTVVLLFLLLIAKFVFRLLLHVKGGLTSWLSDRSCKGAQRPQDFVEDLTDGIADD